MKTARSTSPSAELDWRKIGYLAFVTCGYTLPLQVMKSQAGYYIGTQDEDGLPCSRESAQYWTTHDLASDALDSDQWSQKPAP